MPKKPTKSLLSGLATYLLIFVPLTTAMTFGVLSITSLNRQLLSTETRLIIAFVIALIWPWIAMFFFLVRAERHNSTAKS
jgi:ABC-type enterobactin transport system permease subunit